MGYLDATHLKNFFPAQTTPLTEFIIVSISAKFANKNIGVSHDPRSPPPLSAL